MLQMGLAKSLKSENAFPLLLALAQSLLTLEWEGAVSEKIASIPVQLCFHQQFFLDQSQEGINPNIFPGAEGISDPAYCNQIEPSCVERNIWKFNFYKQSKP